MPLMEPGKEVDESYAQLLTQHREVLLLGSSAGLLGWDQETYLPAAGHAFRAEQCGYLEGEAHRCWTSENVGRLLANCEDTDKLDGAAAANVAWWRWSYERATCVPADFVEAFGSSRSMAAHAWEEAREKDDYALFAPHLEKVVAMTREKAEFLGYEDSPYDALLEDYERGITCGELDRLFTALRPELASVAEQAAEQCRDVAADALAGDYPIAAQQELNQAVAAAFGFDFSAGRIDTTAHPFCTGLGPRDTRLTTRYDPRDFAVSLYGVLHECGHGLYDQGLPEEEWGRPAGEAVSMGVHESQSRLWENHVARDAAFWEHWFPKAAELFPALRKQTPESLTRAVTRAGASFIRVEADETTYDLHIILRFELEKRLLSGDLTVADLPAAWDSLFKESFGLEVPSPAQGCLQDVHWSHGVFGYFPTYSLGNIYAAQLYARALSDRPATTGELACGHYAGLLGWLRDNVHGHGCRKLPVDLMRDAIGAEPDPRFHLDHLRKRYLR